MNAAEVRAWLAAMRAAGRARFNKQAAAALGIDRRTLSRWSQEGVPADRAVIVSLACKALLSGL
jgi:hypothetical protein